MTTSTGRHSFIGSVASHVTFLVGLAGAASISIADTKPAKPTKARHVAKVTMEAARAIALSRVPGTIRAEELEHEGGRWIYSFEIRPTGEQGRRVKEVNLDADSGVIVTVENERE